MTRVVLLGPQPPDSDQVGRMLAELGVTRPVALVTAGWQERELEDEALASTFGVASVNLRLHARSEELFTADAELATAYKARQERLRHMQGFYRMRLEATDDVSVEQLTV